MKKLVLGLLVAGCLALPTVARADDDFSRPGTYLGFGASRTVGVVDAFLNDSPVLKHLDISDRWGLNVRAGYRLTSWFGVEAEYEGFQRFDIDFFGGHLGSLGLQMATVNARFVLPFNRFQPYFLLGAGAVFLSLSSQFHSLGVDDTSFAGRAGLGMDVYLTRNFLLNIGTEALLTPAKLTLDTGSFHGSVSPVGSLSFQFGFGYRF